MSRTGFEIMYKRYDYIHSFDHKTTNLITFDMVYT